VDVRLDRVDRLGDHETHADGRGQVVDLVEVAGTVGVQPVAHRRLVHVQAITLGLVEVVQTAGRQVVHDHDPVAALQEPLDQVRADEAGSPRDEAHSFARRPGHTLRPAS
jgi:hypothetical protein